MIDKLPNSNIYKKIYLLVGLIVIVSNIPAILILKYIFGMDLDYFLVIFLLIVTLMLFITGIISIKIE
jgi:hypothetical protein